MPVIKLILGRKKIVVSMMLSRDEFNYTSVKTTTVLYRISIYSLFKISF